jgi:hypothetical protein
MIFPVVDFEIPVVHFIEKSDGNEGPDESPGRPIPLRRLGDVLCIQTVQYPRRAILRRIHPQDQEREDTVGAEDLMHLADLQMTVETDSQPNIILHSVPLHFSC